MNRDELEQQWHSLVAKDNIPTEDFWSLWSTSKDELKAMGVSVKKTEAGYVAKLGKAKGLKGEKLLKLSNIPTLGEFGAMPMETKVEWVKALPAEAKALGIHVVKHESDKYGAWESVELAGLSSLGLRQSVCWWSNQQADYMAGALKRLESKVGTVNSKSTEERALAMWKQWQATPLNELKFYLLNESAKGLAKYFSPEEVAARADRAYHTAMMERDPAYAFEFIRSKIRGETDVIDTWPGASARDVAEAQAADDRIATEEAKAK